jgi:sialate O-acetylesterase
VLLAGVVPPAMAEVRLPSIFSEHMVLQQGQPIPVWGWAAADEQVTVSLADQNQSATADANGTWRVMLGSLPAGGPYPLEVRGANVIRFDDVLVGEVWICSGGANMESPLAQAKDGDLEILGANYPRIRLVTIPHVGSPQPADNFEGSWQICSPSTVPDFSAVGYFFARQLHQTLNVPIGMIDNAWGESTCEAWIRPETLGSEPRYQPLLASWREREQTSPPPAKPASDEQEKRPRSDAPESKRRRDRQGRSQGQAPAVPPLLGPRRPGNLYHGVLRPVLGYGIRGVIWHSGEANTSRAYQYRHLFPLMIQHWRDQWGQGDFSFYWMQLAAGPDPSAQPYQSARAELREAQSLTLARLPNTGEVVTIDLGEEARLHPAHSQQIAHRLARWALVRDYGIANPYESPRYESFQKAGTRMVVRFLGARDRNAALRTADGGEPAGFAIAGADQRFVPARARIAGGNRVEVWSDEIQEPAAVRYAWDDRPVGNLQNRVGLPLTPFRTDDWPGITAKSDVE